jgi:hypothetical protein
MKEGYASVEVKKIYSVNILYFDLGRGDDYIYIGQTCFKGMHTYNELALNEKQKLLYGVEKIANIYPEYYIIKVNQFNDLAKDTLDEWIYFLKNEEIKDNFKAKGLSEAKDKLSFMKLPNEEQYAYKRYCEDLHYKMSMFQSSYVIGKKEGIIEGIEKGIEKGEKNKAIIIARNLLDILDNETIAQKTGLDISEIDLLRHSKN